MFDNKPKRTVGEMMETYKVRILNFDSGSLQYEEFPNREAWLERRGDLEEEGYKILRHPNRFYKAVKGGVE